MLLLDLLRFAVLAVLAWWLRPHVAVLWRFVFPTRVRVHIMPKQEPATDHPVVQKFIAAGFVCLGKREEVVGRFLERRVFWVLAHPEGIFADVPLVATRQKSIPAGLYLSSWVEDTLFVVTKRVGPDIVRGLYVSQRETGSVEDMLRRHRATLAKHGLGLSPSHAMDFATRENLFVVWHKKYARTELMPFVVLSGVLCLLAVAVVVRMFTFSY